MSQMSIPVHTNADSKLSCPSCGVPIDVEQALEKQATAKLRDEFNRKFSHLKKELDERAQSLERERLEVKELSAKTWEIIQAELKNEKIRLADRMRSEATENAKLEIAKLKASLQDQREANTELKKQELTLMQREQKLVLEREQMKLELEKQVLQRTRSTEQDLRARFQSQHELMKVEYEKRLRDQKRLLDEMHRKMEQGSVQMQGQVQELVIEDYLDHAFPSDRIESIKAGMRGGDCLHSIVNDQSAVCGKIYYESKRTKTFQKTWLEKLNADLRLHRADIGVLITQAMPKEVDQIGLMDGIWVCSFDTFRAFIPLLRYHLLRLGESKLHHQESGEKMQVLYRFLTGTEFRQQVEGIVEGFSQLHEELQKEKRAMQNIWKRREKQIEKVLLNTNHMYATIKGIAGREISPIEQLELPVDQTEVAPS